MSNTFALRAGVAALAALILTTPALAGPIKSMEHYFRVAGAASAAGSCQDLRADPMKLVELGKPFQSAERDPALESRMMDLMMQAMNDTGARLLAEGHDVVCPELYALYGPDGTEVPGLLSKRSD